MAAAADALLAPPTQPTGDGGCVTAQRGDRRLHGDTERAIDRLVADPEPQQHAPAGRVGDQRGGLGADIGVTQVDVGNPGTDLYAFGCFAHQLHRCQNVTVQLGGEHGGKARLLGFARNLSDLGGAPSDARDHSQRQSVLHDLPPAVSAPRL
jgi:hypothetical protein